MPYKKKLILLGSIALFLALTYVLTILLDPSRTNARNERFTWLPSGSRDAADKITITRDGERIELIFKNGLWFVPMGQLEVPARQGRIDDLLRLLSTRGAFPRRGSNSGSHAALGLDGARRIVINGGSGLPLLDLFVGYDDPSGMSVFLRKSGENEFRSGDRLISSYVNGETSSWLNLMLFDDKSVAQVQRVLVYFNDFYGIGEEISPDPYEDYTITRSGEEWQMGGVLDKVRTENWIRAVLEASADDILPDEISISSVPMALIRMELGDGSSIEMQIQEPGEDGITIATVNGKPFMYVLSQWTAIRLLRDQGFFHYNPDS